MLRYAGLCCSVHSRDSVTSEVGAIHGADVGLKLSSRRIRRQPSKSLMIEADNAFLLSFISQFGALSGHPDYLKPEPAEYVQDLSLPNFNVSRVEFANSNDWEIASRCRNRCRGRDYCSPFILIRMFFPIRLPTLSRPPSHIHFLLTPFVALVHLFKLRSLRIDMTISIPYCSPLFMLTAVLGATPLWPVYNPKIYPPGGQNLVFQNGGSVIKKDDFRDEGMRVLLEEVLCAENGRAWPGSANLNL